MRYPAFFIAIYMILLPGLIIIPGSTAAAAESYAIQEEYVPGLGPPVGEVLLVEGQVLIIHAETPDIGYIASSGLPLYKGDTLVTAEDGKISFQTLDQSTITLSVNTRLVINESIFTSTDDGDRAGFMNMIFGKTRFLIRKMTNFGRSEFKVKTKTAIVGVRGSDFVINALPDQTIITAFENTELEVIGLSALCPECIIEPVIISNFRQAIVEMDGSFSENIEIILEEANQLKQEFQLTPSDEGRRRARELEFDRRLRLSLDHFEDDGRELPSSKESSEEEVRDELVVAPPSDDPPEDIADDFSETEREDALLYLPDFPQDPDLHEPLPDESGAQG